MLPRADSRLARGLDFDSLLLLLVAFALPRSVLPAGSTLACLAFAWLLFGLSLLPRESRQQSLWQLAAGAALAMLAACDPLLWLSVASSLALVALVVVPSARALACCSTVRPR